MFNEEKTFGQEKTLDERVAAKMRTLKTQREQRELAAGKDHTKLEDKR